MTSHRPSKGSQQERLLISMLHGSVVDPIKAITELNIMIPSARAAELRRMGWPIRTIEQPHPRPDLFPNAVLPAYFIDNHFRRWYGDPENLGKHPGEYPFKDGRGKFEDWKVDDFKGGRAE